MREAFLTSMERFPPLATSALIIVVKSGSCPVIATHSFVSSSRSVLKSLNVEPGFKSAFCDILTPLKLFESS